MFSYFSVLCKLSFSHFNRNVLFGFEILDVGLEQPIANWAKLGGTAWMISEEGKPGYSKVITHSARTREPLAHIELSTPTS